MKKLVVVLTIVFFAAAVWAAQEKQAPKKAEPEKTMKMGAAKIVIKAGPKGDIAFPHAKHQDKLKKCEFCHDKFGQEPGIIVKLKESGKLEAKAVMKDCIECHKKGEAAKQPTGPTSCVKCHGTAGKAA